MDFKEKKFFKEKIFSHIKKVVEQTFDKYILLLTGSFSKNEETIFKSHDGNIIVLGDIEFIILVPIKEYIIWKIGKRRLNFNLPYKVEFNVLPISAIKYVPKTFFWYETFKTGKVLCKKFLELPYIMLSCDEIWEGDVYEILNHRLISNISTILQSFQSKYKIDVNRYIAYKLNKNILDMLIPLFFKQGKCIVSHRKRIELFLSSNFPKYTKNIVLEASKFKFNYDKIIYKEQVGIKNVVYFYDNFMKFFLFVLSCISQKEIDVDNFSSKDIKFEIGEKSINRKIYILKTALKNFKIFPKLISNKFLKSLLITNFYLNLYNLYFLKRDERRAYKYFQKVKLFIKDFYNDVDSGNILAIDFLTDINKKVIEINKYIYRYL